MHLQRQSKTHPPKGRRHPPGPSFLRGLLGVYRTAADPLGTLLRIQKLYGDLAHTRILSLKVYHLFHPDYVQHVLQDRHYRYNKDNFDYRMLKPVLGEGLVTSDGELWKRQRRLMQPPFHQRRIEEIAPIFTDRARALGERWRQAARAGEVVDVSKEMQRLTLDIATRALFGVDVRDQADSVASALRTVSQRAIDARRWLLSAFWPFPSKDNAQASQAVQQLKDVVEQIVAARRASPKEGNDVLSMMLAARDEHSGRGMSDQQLRDEVMTLLLAGHETTASALSWTWYLLSQHEAEAEKLRSEARSASRGGPVSAEHLPLLCYTRMALEESMRIYPPVYWLSRAARETDEIGGYEIPSKSVAVLSPYVTHRHPDFWPEPESFMPERFSPENAAGRHRFAYFPFGGGPRLCLGVHFAILESVLILATLAPQFRLRVVPDHPIEPHALINLRLRYGLPMRIEEL